MKRKRLISTLHLTCVLLTGCDWCHHNTLAHVCADSGVDADPDAPPPFDAACLAPRVQTEQMPTDADPYEPNDTFVMATPPIKVAYCQNTPMSARISGAGDVDVFRTGECSASPIPKVAIQTIDPWAEISNGHLRVCLFPVCSDGSTHIAGCFVTDAGKGPSPPDVPKEQPVDVVTTELGFRGCCASGVRRATAYVDCPRKSPLIDTYIMVDTGDDHTTLDDFDYTVTWAIVH